VATVLTNAGRAIITNRLKGSGTEPKYVASGTSSTTAAESDTALGTEVESARVDGTSTQQTGDVTNDTYRVVGTIPYTATRAITEAGLFDASSTGNMFVSADFSAINVLNGDSIEFTFNVKFD
jgi:hypothetical protein